LATETGDTLLTIAFEDLGAERVVGRCHAENRPSAALCERLGMRREGHFRRSLWFRGAWADEYIYALLAAEWQARRRG
jgi:RimJ/RimL family protein N-acetyltransferase